MNSNKTKQKRIVGIFLLSEDYHKSVPSDYNVLNSVNKNCFASGKMSKKGVSQNFRVPKSKVR